MERTKFETYAGFAIRAGRLLRGANVIEGTRKHIYSIWVCESASENTVRQAKQIAERRNVPLYRTVGVTLEELVHRDNCKMAAFADESLSRAAEEHADEHFLKLRNSIGGV